MGIFLCKMIGKETIVMKERLQCIRDEALKAIESADMPEKLNDVRVRDERRSAGGQAEGRPDGE